MQRLLKSETHPRFDQVCGLFCDWHRVCRIPDVIVCGRAQTCRRSPYES